MGRTRQEAIIRRRATEIDISAFVPSVHSSEEIAAKHLMVRRWQVETGENEFVDIMDSQHDLSDIQTAYMDNGGQFLVATTPDGNVVGFCGLQRKGVGVGQLKRLAVDPEWQGNGVGSRLVHEILAQARDDGYHTITLATGEGERAKGIYAAHGFETVGFDEQSRDILMRWSSRPRSRSKSHTGHQASPSYG